jgi:hypothetical protein
MNACTMSKTKCPRRRVNDPGADRHPWEVPMSEDRTCSVEGCERAGDLRRGWCGAHYRRWRRYGDPLLVAPRLGDVARFWTHVDKNGPIAKNRPDLGPCWVWKGKSPEGPHAHAHWWADGRSHLAHRYAYEQLRGPIPNDLVLDHFACDNPPCVNPWHVRPVTHWENSSRGNSPAAVNARKTHCIHGHEFTPENTMTDHGYGRKCRECDRERSRKWRAKQKALRKAS